MFLCYLAIVFPTLAQNSQVDPAGEVRDRLQSWTAEAEALKQENPPPASPRRLSLLEVAMEAAEQHLQAIELRKSSESRLKAIEKQALEWKGPEGKPPYSCLLADRYRGNLLAAEEAITVGEGFKKVVIANLGQASDRMLVEDAAVRRAREQVEKARDDTARALARENLADAILKLNTAVEEKAAAEAQSASIELSLQVERARADLSRRQLDAIGSLLVFTDAELKSSLAALDSARARLSGERQRAVRSQNSALNLRIAEAGLTPRRDVIGWRIALLDLRRELLEVRHRWINIKDASAGASEKARLVELFTRPEMWRALLESRQRIVRLAVADQEAAAKPATDRDAAYLAELKAIDREFDTGLDEIQEIAGLQRLWLPSSNGDEGEPGFGPWMHRAFHKMSTSLRSLWEFEIYTVDDTIVLEDGRTSPTKRAITFGKMVFLLGVVLAGYFILRTISARLASRIGRRLHLDPLKTVALRRWFLIFGMCLLGLYALDYVRIPLTAFAFLGGALAIGVGFGTQNLIRNFISGLLIQAEKPMKVGDVVDVGGIQGTVSSIGLRSSIIRHWDGIETLIPNSVFLENNVTNWTHSDHILRCTIKVGVDYGTDSEKVTRLLSETARAHKDVLASPESFVLFEDFSDSALVFGLYFWIDMRKSARMQVASELRHVIARRFEEHSISIAFPQRDLHLSTKEPLRVRVSNESKS